MNQDDRQGEELMNPQNGEQ